MESYPEVIAITGTCGKTTTARFVHDLLNYQGVVTGYIGTDGVLGPQGWLDKSLYVSSKTTPDNATLKALLLDLKKDDVSHVVVEASSHGLQDNRFEGIPVRYGALTNFSKEHLDFHGTMANYRDAKMKIFDIGISRFFLNYEISTATFYTESMLREIATLTAKSAMSKWKIGFRPTITYRGSTEQTSTDRQVFVINGNTYMMNMLGQHNIENAALAILIAYGVLDDIGPIPSVSVHELATSFFDAVNRVPNRMEFLNSQVILDYAHKPEALCDALDTLAGITGGDIHLVIGGCGGRTSIRNDLAREASLLADFIYITDDRPFDEDPASIRKDFIDALAKLRARHKDFEYEEIPDRQEAIKKAIKALKPEDKLLIVSIKDERIFVSPDNKVVGFSI